MAVEDRLGTKSVGPSASDFAAAGRPVPAAKLGDFKVVPSNGTAPEPSVPPAVSR